MNLGGCSLGTDNYNMIMTHHRLTSCEEFEIFLFTISVVLTDKISIRFKQALSYAVQMVNIDVTVLIHSLSATTLSPSFNYLILHLLTVC